MSDEGKRASRRQRLFPKELTPLTKRAAGALVAILIVMLVGTVGVKLFAGYDWVYAFYFMAMIATAEGPPGQPPNAATDIFVSIMAFISIGTLVAAIGTIFGPYLGYLFHKGVHFAQKELEEIEERRVEKKLKIGEERS